MDASLQRGLGFAVVALMLGIPYAGRLFRLLRLLFRGEFRPVVRHFGWWDGAADFFVEGTAAVLQWEVTGAYRIDLLPVGRWRKGNAAEIVVDARQRVFVLTAYGLFGRAQARLELPAGAVRHLELAALSRSTLAAAPRKAVQVATLAPLRKALEPTGKRWSPVLGDRPEPRDARLLQFPLSRVLRLGYVFSTRKYRQPLASAAEAGEGEK